MKNKLLLLLVTSLLFFSLGLFLGTFLVQPAKDIFAPILPSPTSIPYLPHPPTLDQIFTIDHSWIATLSGQHLRTLISTGDVIPARSVNFGATKKNNFRWPYEKTADVLRNADLTVINLETPLIKNCPLTNEGMIFCGDQRNIDGLVFAGVDLVNLANNHSGNYGVQGVEDTVGLLQSNGILPLGLANPVYKDSKGMRFAFLGFNDLQPSGVDQERLEQEIKQAASSARVIIVFFHWGAEYTSFPTKRQIELAHSAVDSGAALVLGSHPHWIQPVEVYKDRLVVYSLGNFIFDQMWSEKTKEGVVARFTFYDEKLVDTEFLPVYIQDFGQPYFLEGEKKERILKEMYLENLKLSQ